MLDTIYKYLKEYGIEYTRALSLSDCTIINQSLFERKTPFAKSIIIFLIPYKVCSPKAHNISLYAAAKDYHLYTKQLFDDILNKLTLLYPENRFEGMCDHSPINETEAAAKAGLGIIGKNRRLINEKYGSYVFIAEIYTDAILNIEEPLEIKTCLGCEKCLKACPTKLSNKCLSEITQKKGELNFEEITLIKNYGSAWGCDICQEVCPMNNNKSTTPINFFKEELIFNLDLEMLEDISKHDFEKRAYSWRGRSVIERNIKILKNE